MPPYLLAQIISIILVIIGWVIAFGGSYGAYVFINKTNLAAWLPDTLSTRINLLPEWAFYGPAAIVFLMGLIILGIGHILLVSVYNARYGAESAQLLDMVRMRGI